MKLNYKKIILWILFVIILINLISTFKIIEVGYQFYQFKESYLKSKNILKVLISEFKDRFYYFKERISYGGPLVICSLLTTVIPGFLSIWVIFLIFPIIKLIHKNFMILFMILWLIVNYAILFYLYKKLKIPKLTFIKIIIYPILLNCFLFVSLFGYIIPSSISYLIYLLLTISMIVYPIYLIGSWLEKIISKSIIDTH